MAKLTRSRSYCHPQDSHRKRASTTGRSSDTAIRSKLEALRRRKSLLEATIRCLEQYRSLPGANGQNHPYGR